MWKWFKGLRIINLLIVATTQVLLYYGFVYHPSRQANADFLFSEFSVFASFVFCTLVISLGGYIINDIYDIEIDKINKPNQPNLPKHFGIQKAKQFYYSLIILGFIPVFMVAYKTKHLAYLWIYPLAIGFLWYYAKRLQYSPIWGNLLVSIFCAAVVLIVYFIERSALEILDGDKKIAQLFVFYSIFAFLSNYLRELIKDLEDMKGDMSQGAQTFPIRFGEEKAHQFILLLIILLVALILLWFRNSTWPISTANRLFFIGFIILPLLVIASVLKNKKYSLLSKLAKWIILAGLINLSFYTSF